MKSVKVETTYSDKMLKKYLNYHYRKVNYIALISACILLILAIVSFVVKLYFIGATTAILAIFFAFYQKILVASSLGANKRLLNTVDNYEFFEDKMAVVSTILEEEVANNNIKYSLLSKIAEDDEYIYIYVNPSSAFLVEKKGLTNEECEFIKSNIIKAIPVKKK